LFRLYGPLLKHWAIFLGILGVLVAFNEWNTRFVNLHMATATAGVMAWLLDLLGLEAYSNGIRVGCSICKFRIIGECTAYYPLSIYIAAVMAFPSPWLRRVLGVLLGVPAILVINQVRLVSLCYIWNWFPDQFETIHIVIWQSLIIFFTVLVWIGWVLTLGRRS
jgi:archaeosortase B (VPXXXP-CTERM-specific)